MKLASTAALPGGSEPAGTLVDAFGGRYYRIAHADRLPTFFMNVVSSSDLWLFLASNGGLTAGRADAEHALFPYQTVDRIYDSAGLNGPVTALWIETARGPVLWEPFGRRTAAEAGVVRHLYKSVEGDRVWFEAINPELGVAFRYGWATSERHGFVRRCELENLTDRPVSLRVLDGLRNVLPAGIPLRLQTNSSCLADAYKTAELLPDTTLAVFALAAGIVDRAIPLESLRSSIACSEGLAGAAILLSDRQLNLFYEGGSPVPEPQSRGLRTSYFLTTPLRLAPRATERWLFVTDGGLGQPEVAARRQELARGDFAGAVTAGADQSTRCLRQLVGAADGLQTGAAETTTAHHFANVLFNIMRGGTCLNGHEIPGRDFAAFVRLRNRGAAERHALLLNALPAAMARADFLARVAAGADRDLERLGYEYLPLIFSRRHGDPSRPWNRFSIRARDARGNQLLQHEGNWRDIFQNWEALCLSHPEFFESIVCKFVNASTMDGFNPYRVTYAGIDWEVPDHEDPWSSIGYWGDHQVIYLLKLLEWSGRFHPGRLESWLRHDLFSYANVPYRIAGYAAMRRDPHATIEFDAAGSRAMEQLVHRIGTDARLVQRPAGGVHHVNLTEKLLVVVLTRLTHFVPGGGIWMNTQRPEWNDANNALVGYGVSVVTLAYLRRMVVHLQRTLVPALGSAPVPVSAAVAALTARLQAALTGHRALLDEATISSAVGRALLDALAGAGSDYRETIYRTGLGTPVDVAPAAIAGLLDFTVAFLDHSLRSNRREDGLYHSYNLLDFSEAPAGLKLHRLGPMLEGQVAVLSSGLLTPAEAVGLLQALRRSALYRADQHSYLLYPDRRLPGFLEKNVIPAPAVEKSSLLQGLVAAGDTRLVVRDADGLFRFAADLVNGAALDERLTQLASESPWAAAVSVEASQIRAAYEEIFQHRAFTGRSGSMFGYEGLGCIYWHMVAKLLVAVQENLLAAREAGDPAAARLMEHYYDVRAGLGFNKTPAEYGAFPTDPYSHTPGHSGAQQPGMTGQVKEEILTRLGELGVSVSCGCVSFAPTFLARSEFTAAAGSFAPMGRDGAATPLALPAGAVAFTFCGTPVIYCLSSGAPVVHLWPSRGPMVEIDGRQLDAASSARLFARDGSILRIEVRLGADFRAYGGSTARPAARNLGTKGGPD